MKYVDLSHISISSHTHTQLCIWPRPHTLNLDHWRPFQFIESIQTHYENIESGANEYSLDNWMIHSCSCISKILISKPYPHGSSTKSFARQLLSWFEKHVFLNFILFIIYCACPIGGCVSFVIFFYSLFGVSPTNNWKCRTHTRTHTSFTLFVRKACG